MVTRENFLIPAIILILQTCTGTVGLQSSFTRNCLCSLNTSIYSMTGQSLIYQEDNETKFVKFSKICLFHIFTVSCFVHLSRLFRFLNLNHLIRAQNLQFIPCACSIYTFHSQLVAVYINYVQFNYYYLAFVCNFQFYFVKKTIPLAQP